MLVETCSRYLRYNAGSSISPQSTRRRCQMHLNTGGNASHARSPRLGEFVEAHGQGK
jgi:hypothetical protein